MKIKRVALNEPYHKEDRLGGHLENQVRPERVSTNAKGHLRGALGATSAPNGGNNCGSEPPELSNAGLAERNLIGEWRMQLAGDSYFAKFPSQPEM